MRLLTSLLLGVAACAAQKPSYNQAGELVRPADYREWIWLTSGPGMTYGPAAPVASSVQLFDNVFVSPEAWRSFRSTGVWPEKTS